MPQPESLFITCTHGVGHHKLHVKYWNKGASGTPLFCVHALTRVADDFVVLAAKFPDRPVYAPEMAGRGRSDALLDSSLYNLAHYVDDCAQVLNALGLSRVDWLGTSLGGMIGMTVAALKPAHVSRLVLNDVGPFLPLAALQRIGAYLGQIQRFSDLDQATRYCRTVYAPFGIQGEDAWHEFTARSVVVEKKGGFRLHYDPAIADVFKQVTGDINLWPLYERITCPTLVLRGENSDVLLAEEAKAMTLRGPKAKLVTFPGVGHAPALESGEQIEVVRDFLQ